MSRKSQVGLLLEVFILLLILILFTMFWGNFSKNSFIAGLLKVDDSSMTHTCSSMAPVILGTDYIMSTAVSEGVGASVVNSFYDYLGFSGSQPFPDAEFFYNRAVKYFPDLRNRVGVSITFDSGVVPDGFVSVFPKNLGKLSELGRLLSSLNPDMAFSMTSCEFPLYSVNESIKARMKLVVYI